MITDESLLLLLPTPCRAVPYRQAARGERDAGNGDGVRARSDSLNQDRERTVVEIVVKDVTF